MEDWRRWRGTESCLELCDLGRSDLYELAWEIWDSCEGLGPIAESYRVSWLELDVDWGFCFPRLSHFNFMLVGSTCCWRGWYEVLEVFWVFWPTLGWCSLNVTRLRALLACGRCSGRSLSIHVAAKFSSCCEVKTKS